MAFAQNPHWAADMMWTSLYSFNDSDIADKPVVHLCPSCKEFVTGTWFIQSLCWGQPICDYEILVRELPEIPSIAPVSVSPFLKLTLKANLQWTNSPSRLHLH